MSDSHGHGDKPFLQHHYEDEDHQFDAGKLGIWAFLVTEVLFFSGLFCAYAIYRAMHPEVFEFAANALDTKWGAINTGVLILSSLSAAWAVRNAQLGQKKMLVVNLAVTIACAFGFMGIKYQEYSHKFHLGVYPGEKYAPLYEPGGGPNENAFGDYNADKLVFVDPGTVVVADAEGAAATPQDGEAEGDPTAATPDGDTEGHTEGEHAEDDAGEHPPGEEGGHGNLVKWDDPDIDPIVKDKLSIFFGIYFCMTGLHGIHVLLGIVVFFWLLGRAIRGHFTPSYYGPIDYAALYWHLVDLIWIYLFPLLYLIN